MKKKLRVYRNLHKKCLSVQHKTDKGWRLLKHVESIRLKSPSYIVSQAGRDRVLREKRKNVHAVVEGYEIDSFPKDKTEWKKVLYNPYISSNFFYADEPHRHPVCTFYAKIDKTGIWA